jgi:hypothetical protein
MIGIDELSKGAFTHPLVSIKRAEIPDIDLDGFLRVVLSIKKYSLILHDFDGSEFETLLIERAAHVVALNAQIADQVTELRQDVVSGFAVASYTQLGQQQQPELRLITFGMAHKIQSRGYFHIGELLSRDPRSFVLEISSALHEGTEFDDSFFEVGDEISSYFQGNVDFLGFLADREVTRRLIASSAMLAFFPRGARENNTSIISAMTLGVPVITNLDSWSPAWMKHGETVFDVEKLEHFPNSEELKAVGQGGIVATKDLTFTSLLGLLGSTPER